MSYIDRFEPIEPRYDVARGVDELRARRTAAALGVDLGPLTDNEVAALAALNLEAARMGYTVDNMGRVTA